ncbi:MAG: ImmA/IrrE family metallo-endopeptidase [Oscillospiraceae bacterium]|nr:ImmA/IrrE family metallo-endopeptidase [Oscillospiraceae bacterium]
MGLTTEFDTSSPILLCNRTGICLHRHELSERFNAYYCRVGTTRNIVVSDGVSDEELRFLIAHEIGHDQLHRNQDLFFDKKPFSMLRSTLEYEANLFASELLLDDDEILELLASEEYDLLQMARMLYVDEALLDFKIFSLKQRGYDVEPIYIYCNKF